MYPNDVMNTYRGSTSVHEAIAVVFRKIHARLNQSQLL